MTRVVRLGGRLAQRLAIALMGIGAMASLGPILTTAASIALSLGLYAAAFGWHFAVGFIVLLLIHELGHLLASAAVGIETGGLWFVPFVGAVIQLKQGPSNAKMAANIAIGGPAAGTLSALLFLTAYFWSDSLFWLVLSYTACLLNLLNLIPCAPLDGGKIAEAITPRLWWIGSLVLGCFCFFTANLLVLLVFVGSLRQLWRQNSEGAYYRIAFYQRMTVGCWYFGLLFLLGFLTWYVWGLLK